MYFNNPEILAEERRSKRISASITTVLVGIFLALCFIWTGFRNNMPPPGETEFEVIGAIDFGDYNMGSKDVNNLEDPVEDPVEEVTEEVTTPVEEAEVSEAETDPTPVVTQEEPSPVTTPDVETPPKKEEPTPPEKVVEKEEVKPTPENNKEKAQEEVKTEDPKPADEPKQTGSNQGSEDNATGNAGLPESKVFDDRYAFQWGTSDGQGAGARRWLHKVDPEYKVQQEDVLTFEFIIKPDGTVANPRMIGLTTNNSLKWAGINAIKSWRFNAIAAGKPKVDQKVRVTITFKLKG